MSEVTTRLPRTKNGARNARNGKKKEDFLDEII